ncbi:MAG: hypothetical protein IKQ87_06350 [Clostridia bacterium]|nr:hypothetical protein [Clostridia bacterium]MBR7034073.1 hypothetical protein [Clostridia bacterium]
MNKTKTEKAAGSRGMKGSEDRREYIYSVALEVAGQIGAVVSAGIAESGYKLRDITGALKDLVDILDVESDADEQERTARLEKLRREISKGDGGEELAVVLEGVDEAWGK